MSWGCNDIIDGIRDSNYAMITRTTKNMRNEIQLVVVHIMQAPAGGASCAEGAAPPLMILFVFKVLIISYMYISSPT